MSKLFMATLLLIAGTTLSGCTNQKLIAEKDLEIASREQTIAELEEQIAALEQEIGSAHNRADQLNEDLQEALGSLQEMEKLSISMDKDRALITMPDAVTFDSGSADLTGEGQMIIDKVWEVLNRYPDRNILVEGHTDNVPIAPQYRAHFRSNWELSTARALSVVHYVSDRFGADPRRLAAVGYGEHRPVADNESIEGRSANRRVVIVVARAENDMARQD